MAQVTKPMALDETLQDVVTALQNITQGGHIVYSGTVGSSTQPIYLNAGVPTAIGAVDVIAEAPRVKSSTELEALCALVVADRKTRFFRIQGTTGMDSTLSDLITYKDLVYAYGWGIISDTYATSSSSYDLVITYFAGPPYPYNSQSRIFIWRNSSGAFRQNNVLITNKDTDIQTGTPTDINTALTSVSSRQCSKSGNVVDFKWVFQITGTLSLASNTVLMKLPWSAKNGYTLIPRIAGGAADSGTHYNSYCLLNGKDLMLGVGTYDGITTNNYITVGGTYLTDD